MPMHGWTRVAPGIGQSFHHDWVSEISRALNRGLLPPERYAQVQPLADGFGPDVTNVSDGAGAYIEPIAVGEPVPDMPLFLEPEYHIDVPLEATYQAAWNTVPTRWRRVIEPPAA